MPAFIATTSPIVAGAIAFTRDGTVHVARAPDSGSSR